MDYAVEVMPAALADVDAYLEFLENERGTAEYAERWWNGLIDALVSLEKMPRRCPVIPEYRHFDEELHHLIYESHRIIFYVTDDTVKVLRIYHGARHPLSNRRS